MGLLFSCLSRSLCLAISLRLSLCLSFSPSLCLFLFLFLALSLSISLSLSLLSMSLSFLSFSRSLSPSLSLRLPRPLGEALCSCGSVHVPGCPLASQLWLSICTVGVCIQYVWMCVCVYVQCLHRVCVCVCVFPQITVLKIPLIVLGKCGLWSRGSVAAGRAEGQEKGIVLWTETGQIPPFQLSPPRVPGVK